MKMDGYKVEYEQNNLIYEVPFDKCYIDTKYCSKEFKNEINETIIKQTNEAEFKVNNENKDGTLNYFSDKNIQKIKKGKAYDSTFTNHVESNIDKQDTRNQFQTENNEFNVNGHSNIPDKLEDISIEGLKDPTVITNENRYTQYGGYIDANQYSSYARW